MNATMRKVKLTILLVFALSISYGQPDSLKGNKFCIEIPPLSYLDGLNCPSYQFASEIKVYQNIAFCIQGGGYFGLNGHDWLTNQFSGNRETEVKGYLVKSEIKIYTNLNHIAAGTYFSLEAVCKNQSFNWQDSIHLAPAYITTFREFKNIYCFNLKVGQLLIYKSGFIIDWYCGLGVRLKNVTSTLTPQEVGALRYSDDSSYDSDETGQTILPAKDAYFNITAGVKIGYRLF